jgi:hypothetical protein
MSEKMLEDEVFRWSQRVEIARKHGQQDVAAASTKICTLYKQALDNNQQPTHNQLLSKADAIRKRIEAAEQHRTMCAEHGLNDAAIDATYEIQALERRLVELTSE